MLHSNTSRILFVVFSVLSGQMMFSVDDTFSDKKRIFTEQLQEQSRQFFDQASKTGAWIGDSATSSVQSVEQLWKQRHEMLKRIKSEASVSAGKIEEVKKTGTLIKDSAISAAASVGQIGDSAIDSAEFVIQKLKDPEQCWLPAGVIGSLVHQLMLRRSKRKTTASDMSSSVKVENVSTIKTDSKVSVKPRVQQQSRIARFVRSGMRRVQWFVVPAVSWHLYINHKEHLKQQQLNAVSADAKVSEQKSTAVVEVTPVVPVSPIKPVEPVRSVMLVGPVTPELNAVSADAKVTEQKSTTVVEVIPVAVAALVAHIPSNPVVPADSTNTPSA